jgi:hypothetical protein
MTTTQEVNWKLPQQFQHSSHWTNQLPAEGDDVGPDEGRAHHPPTTITPPEGNTNPATTPATAPAPTTLPTTTNATQFPATTPAAPTAITPSTTQPDESEVQVLGT